MGFQNTNEMGFMVLEIWLFVFGNILEIFLKEFVRIIHDLCMYKSMFVYKV